MPHSITNSDAALQDLSSDNLINFAQKERLLMLTEEEVEPKLKLSILNSIAGTAVAVKRITSDDANANNDREVASALNEVLKNIVGNPFLKQPSADNSVHQFPQPEVPAVELVFEETSTTLANIDLAEVMK